MFRIISSMIILLFVIIGTSFYVGANHGYDTGYTSGESDALVREITRGKVKCRYTK